MKKTLTLLALLMIAGPQAMAETTPPREVWWTGVTHDPETHKMEGAITTYKHYYAGDSDSDMCWVAASSNVIAWWQDRVEQNGALIIPKDAPRDYEVFETERHLWPNVGGYEGRAIQMWLTGSKPLLLSQTEATTLGHEFQGYYPRLAGAALNSANYMSTFGANPDTMRQKPIYKQYEYTMIQTYSFLPSNYDIDAPDKTRYQWASEKIVEFMENDWGVCWATNTHAMTVYGVELDENGLITKFFNSDNNWPSTGYGYYSELGIRMGTDPNNYGSMRTDWPGSAPTLSNICAIRTTGIRFLDYDVRVGKNLVDDNEFLFSHYCNLIVDGEEDYVLQYDLRDAKAPDSPVEALRVELATEDDWLSSYEVFTDEEVPTGDLNLRGGKVTLVNCAEDRVKLDGGGKVAGIIRFQDSVVKGTTDTIQDANRTLKVDRTDTIAKEINLSATKGTNTLEVTVDNKATFGKLTGEGNLDKTGKGAAEVTDSVSLKGEIRVKEGDFIFGKDVELTGNTKLTVSEGARVQGAEGKAITLTIDSGVHVNDGVMTLTTTVNEGATLKGSGTFAGVTMNGGTLIVGNSPGQQTYTGDLTVNLGDIVFSVDGWNAADEDSAGWDNGVYSNINMGNNAFTVGNDGNIIIALSDEASQALTMGTGELDLTLISNMGNTLSEDELQGLMLRTSFMLSGEQKGALDTPLALDLSKAAYMMRDNALILTSLAGTDNPVPPAPVPEPTTGTLSLLALAGLCARRRRK